jgi:para-nitrobenzyl esterase
LLVAGLCWFGAARAAEIAPIHVEGGLISGTSGSLPGVTVYKGIPFAAPPIGDLRWRPPMPVVPWKGVRPADHFGPACPQKLNAPGSFNQVTFFPGAPAEQSEDCLYLNVWVPSEPSPKPRAVMVWFYGGGMTEGYGSQVIYDGSAFACRGVILVTFNYRLGIFGSFAHPELSRESEKHVSGNYVILDQIAALAWVKRNIAAFGGDPGNVTAFGESAGGASINRLLAAPLAKGLFQKVILESSQILMSRDSRTKLVDMEEQGVRFAQSRHAASLRELRAIPAAELLEASQQVRFNPNIDGVVIPELAVDVFERGGQQAVPMMIGCNGQEGSFVPTRAAAFRADVAKRYGSAADTFLKLYPCTTDDEAAIAKRDERSDQSLAGARAEARGQARLGQPVFLYYFSRRPPGPERESRGSFHGSELTYVFNTQAALDRPWEPVDRKLAELMISYWVHFAQTSNPNSPGLPVWPRFTGSNEKAMGLGETVGPVDFPDATRLDFLEPFIRREARANPMIGADRLP